MQVSQSGPARTHRRRRPPSCMIVTAMIVTVSPQWVWRIMCYRWYTLAGPYSLNDETFSNQISQNGDAVSYGVKVAMPFWRVTGVSPDKSDMKNCMNQSSGLRGIWWEYLLPFNE